MNEQKIFNTENYLNKLYKNNEMPSSELDEAIERLSKPQKSIEYKDRDSVEISNDEYAVNFEYSPISEESREDLENFLKYIEQREDYKEFLNINGWRELNALTVNFKNDSENKIDFQKIIPDGYKIFFFPYNQMINGWAAKKARNICVIGDFTAPITLITLLHEIGHAWDFENLDKMNAERMVSSHMHANEAERLREERTASGFALKAIRPFFKTGNILRKDALAFLKLYALESYHDSLKQKIFENEYNYHHIGKYMLQDAQMEEQEERSRMIYDDFMEWKKTDEYREWKKLDKYKDADEYDEFGLWTEWCEENGTAWWKENK